jgi:hypothetical protein
MVDKPKSRVALFGRLPIGRYHTIAYLRGTVLPAGSLQTREFGLDRRDKTAQDKLMHADPRLMSDEVELKFKWLR